ncbi:hypothetical protein [Leptolyngbya ohadii]|uniref:hypothetical protein n=1 Tax=Leptolyngbya ohadii TaxID=1962290 RepID=UPI000B5A0AE7|nr:hypothetical protein [Leptolyngbya ohadii]
MIYQSNRQSNPWRTLAERLEKPLTGLFITLGLAVVSLPGGAVPAEAGATQRNSRSLADGVYLYGQSAEPEQIGAAYMVFEVNQGNVTGAFYMPRSSFDCFHGQFEANRLALSVIDSYEQTEYPYAIALDSSNPVAMTGEETIAPVGLEGFERIDQLSENDQRILSTCQAELKPDSATGN